MKMMPITEYGKVSSSTLNGMLNSDRSDQDFSQFLSDVFHISDRIALFIEFALALSPVKNISTADGLSRVHRHLTSIGVYGEFPIVVPMYGGGGEIAQAFCRASAVKGATYMLDRRIKNVETQAVNFENGERCLADHIIISSSAIDDKATGIAKYIVALNHPCDSLVSDDSVAAFVTFPPGSINSFEEPIQVIVHGSGTGSCPQGQSIANATHSNI